MRGQDEVNMLGTMLVATVLAATAAEEAAAPAGPHTVHISSRAITIDFDPARSTEIQAECTQIGHLQFIQMWAVNDRGWHLLRPSDVREKSAWLDPAMSDAGHVLDTVRATDVIHQEFGDRGDTTRGRHARVVDAPQLAASRLPPYHPEENPDGWKKQVWRFQSYAYCADGADRGRWYEGVAWTFELSPESMQSGDGFGRLAFVANLPAPIDDPDASVRQALARYVALPTKGSGPA